MEWDNAQHVSAPTTTILPTIVSMFTSSTVDGGARGVIVIVVGNEHGDPSSNPGLDWLHFT